VATPGALKVVWLARTGEFGSGGRAGIGHVVPTSALHSHERRTVGHRGGRSCPEAAVMIAAVATEASLANEGGIATDSRDRQRDPSDNAVQHDANTWG
jgi:hypothetical protein